MEVIDLLRQQFKECNEWLASTMNGVTSELAHWKPPGTANPLGATYTHILLTQDIVANGALNRGAPLSATTWANRVGISELPPADEVTAWAQWARLVRVDLDALEAYGLAVQTSVEQVLTSLTSTELDRTVETPFGSSTVQSLVGVGLIGHTHSHTGEIGHTHSHTGEIGHTHSHTGEIACLKGLQGAKGYAI